MYTCSIQHRQPVPEAGGIGFRPTNGIARIAVTAVSVVLGVNLLTWWDAESWWSSLAAIAATSTTTVPPGAPEGRSRNDTAADGFSLLHSGTCSCRTSNYSSLSPDEGRTHPFRKVGPDPCCRRVAVSGHKFGTVLKRKLFREFHWIEDQEFDRALFPPGEGEDEKNIDSLHPQRRGQDYRHVAIVRDVHSALVSGYLYHKSGHECWVNPLGRPWTKDRMHNWSQVLEEHYPADQEGSASLGPYPAEGGRSLCQYLSEESAEVGMKVYMAYSRHAFYDGVLPYLEEAARRVRKNGPGSDNVLWVCLEEASDPSKEEEVFYRLMDWLHPNGHRLTFPGTVEGAAGHGTDHHDVELRRSLLQLAKRYDAEVFGGTFLAMSSYFDCAETLR